MSHYQHITPEEREKILLLRPAGRTITEIARRLGRSKSTISRELHRNTRHGRYSAILAQSMYEERRKRCRPRCQLGDPHIYETVRDKFLEHQWSPEEIAKRISLEQPGFSISTTTIYRGIYAGRFDKDVEKCESGVHKASRKLRHRGKRRHSSDGKETRGKIHISHDITERPQEAAWRSRLGDWEGDTVLGKQGGACLVTLVDRKSRFLLSKRAKRKDALSVRDAMIACLTGHPVHSITPDQGKEFAKHREVSTALGDVPFYFPPPGEPWQRGTNENTNGLLREYFPKGTDLAKYSEEYIQSKGDELNMRPRKCLGYLTPYEVYYATLLHLV